MLVRYEQHVRSQPELLARLQELACWYQVGGSVNHQILSLKVVLFKGGQVTLDFGKRIRDCSLEALDTLVHLDGQCQPHDR